MAPISDDISINTLIGKDSAISGNIHVSGFVRIDGDIDGDLETTGKLIIGEKARIRGNVTALSAIIGGIVEGDVFAEEGIQIFSTASIFGDIITKHLKLEEGVLYNGYCIALSDPEKFEQAKLQFHNRKLITERISSNL